MLYIILACGVLGVIFALVWRRQVLAMDQGTEDMKRIAGQIQEGAFAYLNRQFRTITWMVAILIVILFLTTLGQKWDISLGRILAFVLGAFFSGFTGYVGMTLAVRGNVRCTQAARTSLSQALFVAFRSGAVTGMFTVSLGLIGAAVIFMIYREHATEVLLGFGFGGSLLALFMRVGGGIYTKAADVGADLVGKVEAGIPEDDPRNAAVIADNVGDNVGDCAGMAADIFESYEVTLVASMILALAHVKEQPLLALAWIMFPLLVRAVGVITSIFGIWIVKLKNDEGSVIGAITKGFVWAAVFSAVGFFLISKFYVGNQTLNPDGYRQWPMLFWATFSGLLLAIAIYKLTEYYTNGSFAPVKSIARSTQTGSATTILTGLAEGLEGSVWALLAICASMYTAIIVFGQGATAIDILYGVSLTGLGMLTTTGVIISMDTYGPIADNAQGICEMAKVEEAGENVAHLDSVGNTTKAATKGIAIASAVIAAVALFGSFLSKVAAPGAGETVDAAALKNPDVWLVLNDPKVFIGLLVGGAMPFLFSSMTIRAVSRAAYYIINEVRRQFREIPGLMEGKAMPESAKVVDICTTSALRELIGPGVLAILSPLVVGAWLGWPGLGGFLAGIIVVGQLLAVFMCDAGGAWDNAKKTIEDGLYGGKGSDSHHAAVVGDTVGDPLKDTSGPALNPLLKVMNLVALLATPLIVKHAGGVGLSIAAVIMVAVIAIALIISKRETEAVREVQSRLEVAEK
ncbi:MAG: sodium-translocating pyrophosphatase [candidate division WS1 bacterium]|nr:sodium-translocating pyrophosphatase [candidate division WS1 bacterium]